MNRLLLILFVVIGCLMTSINALAQELSYSDFMKLNNLKRVSEVNDILIDKGYKYDGTYKGAYDSVAYWTKGCHITCYNKNNVEWDIEGNYSFYRWDYLGHFRYVTSSSGVFDSFITAAKNNGYKFAKEDVFAERTRHSYIKVTSDDNIHILQFDICQGYFFIGYYIQK